MRLLHGLQLAYCTNVHPGEDWAETFDSLNRWTLAVKDRLECKQEYAIGLRLSDRASRELIDPRQLLEFQRWLDRHNCYVFTINGFPFGRFHGGQVKERVYLPDWTSKERLDYTNRLFDLLALVSPPGSQASVSTLPGSFKEFIRAPEQVQQIRANLWRCVEHIAQLSERTGRDLHLGLEPEPLGLFENSVETVAFFSELREQHPADVRLNRHLGVNYDTCHFAVEFEQPEEAIALFQSNEIRLSKIHLSNALKLRPTPEALTQLAAFTEEVYLHQVIARQQDGALIRFKDLPIALEAAQCKQRDGEPLEMSEGFEKRRSGGAFQDRTPIQSGAAAPHSKTTAREGVSSPQPSPPGEEREKFGEEWRVHFHVPLHCQKLDHFETTSDHVVGLLKLLQLKPGLCSHLEMETYTWAVLPESLKTCDVSDQIVSEYHWTLERMAEHGLGSASALPPAR